MEKFPIPTSFRHAHLNPNSKLSDANNTNVNDRVRFAAELDAQP